MTTIAKGTRVYRFVSWDHRGTIAFQEFTVGSWGAQQRRDEGDTNHPHEGGGSDMENTKRFTGRQLATMKEAADRYLEIATAAADALELLEASLKGGATYPSIMRDVNDSRGAIQSALRKMPLLSEVA